MSSASKLWLSEPITIISWAIHGEEKISPSVLRLQTGLP
jgi:hypothetical protein